MIKLKTLSDIIVNKHWSYFINSKGYERLKEYSEDSSLSFEEKTLYKNLITNKAFIKKLICGHPNEIISCITEFSILISGIPELLFTQLPTYNVIYNSISTTNGLSVNERTSNKQEILKKLIVIDELCVEKGVYSVKKSRKNLNNFSDKKITIKEIEALFKDLKTALYSRKEMIISRLNEIFDYEAFTSSFKDWGAYELTKSLMTSVCPYCNRSFIVTLLTDYGKTRPELDHFYPKSRFPYLALSIYNLIPSCHICNSNFKGSIDFYSIPHIHQYEDNFTNKFQFYIDVSDEVIGDSIPDIENFNIEVKILTDEIKESIKINNSIKTFKYLELYNQHKDVAKEILEKAVFYNDTRINELMDFFENESNDQNTTTNKSSAIIDESVKRFVVGNFVEDGDIGKRNLAKYMRDIAMGTELKKYLK
jgi:hypothetical protein